MVQRCRYGDAEMLIRCRGSAEVVAGAEQMQRRCRSSAEVAQRCRYGYGGAEVLMRCRGLAKVILQVIVQVQRLGRAGAGAEARVVPRWC